MSKFIVIENWFSGLTLGTSEQMEIRACVDTIEEAKIFICQNKCKNKHKWFIYSLQEFD